MQLPHLYTGDARAFYYCTTTQPCSSPATIQYILGRPRRGRAHDLEVLALTHDGTRYVQRALRDPALSCDYPPACSREEVDEWLRHDLAAVHLTTWDEHEAAVLTAVQPSS